MAPRYCCQPTIMMVFLLVEAIRRLTIGEDQTNEGGGIAADVGACDNVAGKNGGY